MNYFIDDPLDGPRIEHHRAEEIRIGLSASYFKPALARARIEVVEDTIRRSITAHLTTYMVGMFDREIVVDEKWPTDWLQAFKERWLPAWALRRFPVKYRTINIRERIYKSVCPHVDIPDGAQHLEFMAMSDIRHRDSASRG